MRAAPALASLLAPVLALGLSSAGCMDPLAAHGPDEAGGAPLDLALVVRDDAFEGARVVLENVGEVAVRLPCGPHDCGSDLAFDHQAMQDDGTWHTTTDFIALDEAVTASTWVEPGASLTIGHIGYVRERPGTFRYVAQVIDPSGARYEVAREHTTVGWPSEVLERGRGILERVDESECAYVRRAIVATLRTELEPDALLDFRADMATEPEATSMLIEMIDRGTFVREVVEALSTASIDDVREAADQVRFRGPLPVRAGVASRYFELLDDYDVELTMEDHFTLTSLADAWPEEGPAILVGRLANGRDEGEPLRQIVDTFRYVDRALFEPHAETILDALDARCAGAAFELAASCGLTREHFTSGLGLPGVRGFGTSSRCGGAVRLGHPVCVALTADWHAIEAAAAPMQTHDLGVTVRRATVQAVQAVEADRASRPL